MSHLQGRPPPPPPPAHGRHARAAAEAERREACPFYVRWEVPRYSPKQLKDVLEEHEAAASNGFEAIRAAAELARRKVQSIRPASPRSAPVRPGKLASAAGPAECPSALA